VLVDCSHGNSQKNHLRQADVAAALCDQLAAGSQQIFGAMLESHLQEGRQDLAGGGPLRYGQSITDACLSFDQTEPLLERFARAQQARG
jgi:3-deoxy-7-phosphoheptulonate synthase